MNFRKTNTISIPDDFKEAFQSNLNLIHIKATRVAALVGSFVYTLFYFTGIDKYANPIGYQNFLLIRLVVSGFLIALFILSFIKPINKYSFLLSSSMVISCGFGISLMIRSLGYQSTYYVGLIIVYLGSVFFPWGLVKSVIIHLIIYSFYFIPILLYDIKNGFDYGIFLCNNDFLWAAIVLASAINQFNLIIRKQEILNRLTIKKQSEELKAHEEAKRIFIGNITHDLKTPLSVVSGHTDILREFFAQNYKESKHIDFISSSVNQANHLLDKLVSSVLLDSNNEKPQIEVYDYPLYIQEFCNLFTIQSIQRQITFDFIESEEKIIVAFDPIWIERIIVIYYRMNSSLPKITGRFWYVSTKTKNSSLQKLPIPDVESLKINCPIFSNVNTRPMRKRSISGMALVWQ